MCAIEALALDSGLLGTDVAGRQIDFGDIETLGTAAAINGETESDGGQPGLHVAHAAGAVAMHAEEDFLGNVFGVVNIAQYAVGDGEGEASVKANDSLSSAVSRCPSSARVVSCGIGKWLSSPPL